MVITCLDVFYLAKYDVLIPSPKTPPSEKAMAI